MATTLDFALLSLDTYLAPPVFPEPVELINGWQRQLNYERDDPSGFGAAVYEKNGEYVIAFRGWDELDADDINDIFGGAYSGDPFEQMAQAQALYDEVRAANPTASITLTGHSLGGGLAAAIAVRNNETAETFAAIEMTEATYESMNGYSGSGWQIPTAQANTTLTREQIGNFGLVTNHVVADEIANWSDLPFVPDNIGVEENLFDGAMPVAITTDDSLCGDVDISNPGWLPQLQFRTATYAAGRAAATNITAVTANRPIRGSIKRFKRARYSAWNSLEPFQGRTKTKGGGNNGCAARPTSPILLLRRNIRHCPYTT
jgi:pimeloyl-ACP methyl ester carboxylesterase